MAELECYICETDIDANDIDLDWDADQFIKNGIVKVIYSCPKCCHEGTITMFINHMN